MVDWIIDIKEIENLRICYFEQLAFLRLNQKAMINLAYSLIEKAFHIENHDIILATTVLTPRKNKASVSLLKVIGGKEIGIIEEQYPEVGNITSQVHMIKKQDYDEKVKRLSFYPQLTQDIFKW